MGGSSSCFSISRQHVLHLAQWRPVLYGPPAAGGAWQAPLQISGAETTGTAIGGDIKTNSHGDVFAFWPDTGSQNLFVAKSTDGGVSFGVPVSIATTFGSFDLGVPAQDDRRVLIYLSGGAYRTASQNLVYACWVDLAGGPGCNAFFDEPGNNVLSTCKSRIWFSRSTDGGATWDPARKLNDQNSLNDQIFPRLAVDETTGVLVVVYYDTIADPGRVKTDLWMQSSSDHGATWTKASPVTTAETNETSASAELNFQYGDYIGLTGHAGRFFACWTDRRSGGTEEIWGAPLTITDLAIAIADKGNFGHVCVGAFADGLLVINNNGSNPLWIFNITSSSGDFEPPGVSFYPLLINPGESIDLVIRFQPTTIGAKSAILTIFSNAQPPHKIRVSGDATAPRLSLMIANRGNLGKACEGGFVDGWLILNNSGRCMLSITDIISSSTEFKAPQVLSYPLSIAPGGSLPVPIRFEPSSAGIQSGVITVFSNDPAGSHSIKVFGDAPTGKLVVSGSTHFGGVKACCVVERTISVCNAGDCSLRVDSVAFKHKSKYWKLISNPFPATLRPGSCLSVTIRYRAAQRIARPCELEIISNDPSTPVKVLELTAYTIWSDCQCKQGCKGCCEKCHHECCCEQHQVCCDDDEDDGGDEE